MRTNPITHPANLSLATCVLMMVFLPLLSYSGDLVMTSDPNSRLQGGNGGWFSRGDTVTVYGGPASLEGKFENASGEPDLQGWTCTDFSSPVGAFAKVWPLLDDRDQCNDNLTPQLAFIDDGLVVPGTGGYLCSSFCYGPNDYIVNPEGGLAGSSYYIYNEAHSPIIAWPNGSNPYTGCVFSFDVYRDEELNYGSPGMFYVWSIRSTSSSNPDDIETQPWVDRGYIYYGPPSYIRPNWYVSDLLVPGAKFVQVSVGVRELGYMYGIVGTNGTPAPYFDNISVKAFLQDRPEIDYSESNLAHDSFPPTYSIDYDNLALNSVRFDAAIDHGDSIVAEVIILDPEETLVETPRLHYRLFANPLFDSVRSMVPPGSGNSFSSGSVAGVLCLDEFGTPVENTYCFDLPDEGFLFPGDVLHYFLRAEDSGGGVTVAPADTTGFGHVFTGESGTSERYTPMFTMHALPTMTASSDHPTILLWDDSGNHYEGDYWLEAMAILGMHRGDHYDLFETRDVSSSVGNGLGGQASWNQLVGYDIILYTCGNRSSKTLTSDQYSDDIQILKDWMTLGYGNTSPEYLFLLGEDLAFDLYNRGEIDFLQNFLGITYQYLADDIYSLIGNQRQPQVLPVNYGSTIFSMDSWQVDAGCPLLNELDSLNPISNPGESYAESIAEFASPGGTPGGYFPQAGIFNNGTLHLFKTITFPYAFKYIYDPLGNPGEMRDRTRVRLLADVLYSFDYYDFQIPGFYAMELNIPGTQHGSVAWGDYDGDEDLDVLLTGETAEGYISSIFRNDGAGLFTDIAAGLTGVSYGLGDWIDYDNDGDLDVMIAGKSVSDSITQIYRNDGSGTFVNIEAGLTGIRLTTADWGDYDNDGDYDFLVAGTSNILGKVILIGRNDGNGQFTETDFSLWEDEEISDVNWSDFDADGDLDILICGKRDDFLLYSNNGDNSFTELDPGFEDVEWGSSDWGDYDGDGDLDVVIAGKRRQTFSTNVYRNDGTGSFTQIGIVTPEFKESAVDWGDWDNDGDLDIILVGDGNTSIFSCEGPEVFLEVDTSLAQIRNGDVTWGDFDGDGDLDILLTGDDDTSSSLVTKVYRNHSMTTNTPATVPEGLNASLVGTDLSISWNPSYDLETPTNGISYGLRIGTTPGGSEILSAMANPETGFRQIAGPGNVRVATSLQISVPSVKTPLYWSVQAIDSGFLGSQFSAEQVVGDVSNGNVAKLPVTYALHAAAPNPFNPMTTIRFDLPVSTPARLEIFDIRGRRVRVLIDEVLNAGWHQAVWRGTNSNGQKMASGVYFCRIQAGVFTKTTELTLVK